MQYFDHPSEKRFNLIPFRLTLIAIFVEGDTARYRKKDTAGGKGGSDANTSLARSLELMHLLTEMR